MWCNGTGGDCWRTTMQAAAVAGWDSSIMRRFFFFFARALLIDNFEMALITFVNVSHVANSDSICSLMTSGSSQRTSGIRRPAGSGTSLVSVSTLLAQIMCDSLSCPSLSSHLPRSSSFKMCPLRRLLLSLANFEEVIFFGQQAWNTVLTTAQFAVSTAGKASYQSSVVFPDFNLF